MFRLEDKIAVVTGASRGMGRATSLALAQAGATVALLSRSEEDLKKVAAEIERQGGKATVHPCDVTRGEQVASVIKEISERHGGLHILVNNAGVTKDNLIMRMSEEDWELPLAVNLRGAFNCTKAVARPMLKQRWGRIINITSVVGVTGNPGQANCAASKAGLIALTKSTAKELASRGITVNAVGPGFISTEMTADLSDKAKEDIAASIPLGRLGQPEDVAPAITFLASDAAGYITGQTLLVDGGMVM